MSEDFQYLQFGLNLLSTVMLCIMFYIVYNNTPGKGGPKGRNP